MTFVKPIEFAEAVAKLGQRRLIGKALSSRQWSRVPVAIRERAFFSANVASAKFLSRAKGMINDFLTGAVETLPNGQRALKVGSREDFVKRMQEFARAEGLGDTLPPDIPAAERGLIERTIDVQDETRLRLIFESQTRMAYGYGNWKQGNSKAFLRAFPAQRFIRGFAVQEPRPLHVEFEDAVRRKDDLDFWLRMNNRDIGGFEVPWGPWGFNSGMDVRDVRRRDAIKLGLIKKREAVKVPNLEFNQRLKFDASTIDPGIRKALESELGDLAQLNPVTEEITPVSKAPLSDTAERRLKAALLKVRDNVEEHERRKNILETQKQTIWTELLKHRAERAEIESRKPAEYPPEQLPGIRKRRKELFELEKLLESRFRVKNNKQIASRKATRLAIYDSLEQPGESDFKINDVRPPIVTELTPQDQLREDKEQETKIKGFVRKTKAWIKKLFGPDVLKGRKIEIKEATQATAYYQPSFAPKKQKEGIHINNWAPEKTYVHEIGHWIEAHHKEILDSSLKFRAERAALSGEKVPGRSASGHRAWTDKFIVTYAGRIYRNKTGEEYAAEILTVGLEELYADPIYFYNSDRDYFNFIVHQIYGVPYSPIKSIMPK